MKEKNKSKVIYLKEEVGNWKPGKRRKYMKKWDRNDCSTIFKARTRMQEVKNNDRKMYSDKNAEHATPEKNHRNTSLKNAITFIERTWTGNIKLYIYRWPKDTKGNNEEHQRHYEEAIRKDIERTHTKVQPLKAQLQSFSQHTSYILQYDCIYVTFSASGCW